MSLKSELYAEATRLNVKGRSKMNVDELLAAVQDTPGNRVVVNRHGDVSVKSEDAPEITRDTPLMDRVGPTAIVTNEGGHTTIDDTHDTGRVFMFPNPEDMPSVESAHRMRPSFTDVYGGNRKLTKPLSERKIIRMVRASQSRRYGQGGRGMGAKHYPDDFRLGRGARRVFSSDATKPLAYGDRVRHYAKQNGQPTAKCDGFPGPLLTPAQWRRIDKKDNVLKFVKFSFATKERRYV